MYIYIYIICNFFTARRRLRALTFKTVHSHFQINVDNCIRRCVASRCAALRCVALHYRQGHANAGELLVKMLRVGSKLIASSGLPAVEFKMGFHAVPSMTHLHLHVVSQDFDSQCLKNKKHWNSFTTDFFVSFAEMRQAVLDGGVVDFSAREHRIKQDLKCHRCDAALLNMPKLKAHIATCRA